MERNDNSPRLEVSVTLASAGELDEGRSHTNRRDSDAATADTATPHSSLEPNGRPMDAVAADGLAGDALRWQGTPYTLIQALGSGKFATVYSMAPPDSDEPCGLVVKVTQLAGLSAWAKAQLKLEEDIWTTLSHPNIVRCFGSLADATRHALILEHAPGGELFDRIMDETSFNEGEAARQVAQVLDAVRYLHARGVLHRDLKPENLLLASAAPDAMIKVADFGAAKRMADPLVGDPSSQPKTPCGSLGYAAPEQLHRGAAYDVAVDVWSVGVIAYILLSGTMPFDPATYTSNSLRVSFPEAAFPDISTEAREFICALLQASTSTAARHRPAGSRPRPPQKPIEAHRPHHPRPTTLCRRWIRRAGSAHRKPSTARGSVPPRSSCAPRQPHPSRRRGSGRRR